MVRNERKSKGNEMETNDKPKTQTEICTIRIGFPVETDEQAIEYKKKISEILSDIPQVRFEFNISNMAR